MTAKKQCRKSTYYSENERNTAKYARIGGKSVQFYDRIAVIGLQYYAADEPNSICVGDLLTLVREPENVYDSNAVAVLDEHRRKIGYIPKMHSQRIAMILDDRAKMIVQAVVVSEYHGHKNLEIDLWLRVPWLQTLPRPDFRSFFAKIIRIFRECPALAGMIVSIAAIFTLMIVISAIPPKAPRSETEVVNPAFSTIQQPKPTTETSKTLSVKQSEEKKSVESKTPAKTSQTTKSDQGNTASSEISKAQKDKLRTFSTPYVGMKEEYINYTAMGNVFRKTIESYWMSNGTAYLVRYYSDAKAEKDIPCTFTVKCENGIVIEIYDYRDNPRPIIHYTKKHHGIEYYYNDAEELYMENPDMFDDLDEAEEYFNEHTGEGNWD